MNISPFLIRRASSMNCLKSWDSADGEEGAANLH